MPAGLLERRDDLRVLRAALDRARSGNGGVALVAGEAGIGKTAWCARSWRTCRRDCGVLVGGLRRPARPAALGPLRDVAPGRPAGPLRAGARRRSREACWTPPLARLAGARPTVLLIEDVHWADDATLDVLRQLARRLDRVPALVVLTYRPDDVAPGHPLQALLGDLAGRPPPGSRCPASLSRGDRRARPARGRDGACWRAPAATRSSSPRCSRRRTRRCPPPSSDAVLARLHQLEPAAQRALEQLAVVPTLRRPRAGRGAARRGLDAGRRPERRGIVSCRRRRGSRSGTSWPAARSRQPAG